MDKDKERQRRLKELEEKKKKLEEYKNRSKKPAEAEKTNIDKITDFDEIIKVADNLSGRPKSTTPTSVSPAPVKKETTESVPTKSPSTSSVAIPDTTATTKQRKISLGIQKLADVDVPPREIEMYNKSTQTSSTTEFPDEPNISHSKSPREVIHAESSLVHKKNTEESPAVTSTEKEPQPPPDLPLEEKEKIMQTPAFADFLTKSAKIIERALYTSSKYDITVDYSFADEDGKAKTEDARAVTLQMKLFDERWSKHRAVTDVAWSPKHPELILASYSANEQGTNDPDGLVLVWSTHNTLQRPEFRFHCQSPVTSAFFDKFSPTIIIGGTYSGQLVLWDTRARTTPVQHSPLSSVGHTHPVYCMDIVGTKNANNLVTISTDGKLCVWTLENLLQPLEVLELHNKQSKSVTATAPVAVTSLAFPESEVNGFFVGSEEGAVYEAYRHGSKSGVYERYDGHHGPVTGIDFHPGTGQINFSDLFITSSTDWTCKLWNSKAGTKPIYSFEEADDYIYDVRWCPSHPAMFATVDGTGSLDLWNLNEETEIPILKTAVSQRALNRLRWSSDGKKILTGDSLGNLFIYDTGDICVPKSEEWNIFEETVQKMVQVEHDPAAQPNAEKKDLI